MHSDDNGDNNNGMDDLDISNVTRGSGEYKNSSYGFSNKNWNTYNQQPTVDSYDDLYVLHDIQWCMSTRDIDKAVLGFTDCQKRVYDVIDMH